MAPVSLPDVEVLTFDLYGTIVDMQQGLVETITPFLAARGYSGEDVTDSFMTRKNT